MPASAKAKKPRDRSSSRNVLLAWYDVHRRVLPWRAPTGKRADPYRVWLSEIMLQQTTVQAVAGYYRKFLTLLAGCEGAGGAPSRMRCWPPGPGLAITPAPATCMPPPKSWRTRWAASFPPPPKRLRALPGVGGYTSGAIAAIAYDEKQAAMDANAERVIARLYAVEDADAQGQDGIARAVPGAGAGAGRGFRAGADGSGQRHLHAQAAGLSATARWAADCEARKRGIQEQLPVKAPKIARPLKRGAAFVARDASGAVLLVKRPDKGLLASMLEPPLGPWGEDFPSRREGAETGAVRSRLEKAPRHRAPRLHPFRAGDRSLCRATSPSGPKFNGQTGWPPNKLRDVALPTVMRKIVEHGLDEGGPLFRLTKALTRAAGAARRSAPGCRSSRTARRSSHCRRPAPAHARPSGGSSRWHWRVTSVPSARTLAV